MLDLVKVSKRSLRKPCADCGNVGPFYEGTDNGKPVLIVRNAATKATPTGGTVSRGYLHICAPNGATVPAEPGNWGVPAEPATEPADEPASVPAEPAEPATVDELNAVITGNPAGNGGKTAQELLWDLLGRPQVDRDEVRAIAREEAANVIQPVKTVVLTATETRDVSGVTHKQFDTVVKLLNAPKLNVQLVGGPGVGKTHMCGQAAEALGVEFYSIGFHLQSTASELKGYMDATGNYIPTVVFDWAVNPNGGLLLCDELDRSHPGIQAGLNSLLSNRFITLPNRETVHLTDAHKVIAATNTNGTGPTAEFPAAMPFSSEFRDRFFLYEIEIDEDIELVAAMGMGAPRDLTERAVAYVQRVRQNVKANAIKGVTISPRASQFMASTLATGLDWDTAVNGSLRKGMSDEHWAKVS